MALQVGRAGAIVVRLDDAGPSHELTIIDDGHGPGADFDLGTSRSLGLRIVKAMAAQLGGRFTLERQGDHTVSRLSFVPLAMD
jgi:two-component system, sensor histidine kinase PdtaS